MVVKRDAAGPRRPLRWLPSAVRQALGVALLVGSLATLGTPAAAGIITALDIDGDGILNA
jgi:hypothetical protein